MAITTRNELKDAIAAWGRRSDLTTVADDFIAAVEHDIAYGNDAYGVPPLRVWQLESLEDINLTASSNTATLPSRIVDIKYAYFDGLSTVAVKPAAALIDMYVDGEGATPKYCAIAGGGLLVAPTPSEDMTLSAMCVISANPLTSSNTTNIVLQNYPSIYLFGCLAHCFAYLRNDAEEAKYAKKYAGIVRAANGANARLKASGIQSSPMKRVP